MAFHGIGAADKFEAASSDIFNRFGIRLTLGHDFDEYREYVAEARPDHAVGDPFRTDLHRLHNRNAVWVIGRDETGQIMHTQALRVLPTASGSVADYFRAKFHGFSPSEMDIDYERSRYRAGPGAKRIKGKVVYSGETWIGGDKSRYRGSGLSSILGRYALLTALRELDANYVVGFMIKPVAYKGFCLRMGFMHAEPLALRWYVHGKPDPMETVMVYMSDEDIRFLLDLPTSEVEALAA
ncbi:hypothetical protein [Tateyamaria sp. ANG-S1]|uniref:hypothetical protein n=1 Tax=Tateyamaria sp. ANG-S1 TaxID=1577905 RepID=UPI000580569A|nr:hypothetical protein [Tateyamaria sp. ANG-S1]KIC52008.1 hypothetical protein RA29_01620 [Tateyamaria sp. ANG-S1]